jgi:hypothetical protein
MPCSFGCARTKTLSQTFIDTNPIDEVRKLS